MLTRARTIEERDIPAARQFLLRDPVNNLALLAKLEDRPRWFSRQDHLLGFYKGGSLEAVCLVSPNIIISEAGQEAIDAFAGKMRSVRFAGSIVGPASAALGLWNQLKTSYGVPWTRPRNVRTHQPVMYWSRPSQVSADPLVAMLTPDDYPSYLSASAHMYEHEVGVDPMLYGPSYTKSVRARLAGGLAFGIKWENEVVFKSDLGITWGNHAQIAGVWLDPRLRGKGMAAQAMTGVLELCASRFANLSLYVNDFNTPARRTYEKCGFDEVGAFATIHF